MTIEMINPIGGPVGRGYPNPSTARSHRRSKALLVFGLMALVLAVGAPASFAQDEAAAPAATQPAIETAQPALEAAAKPEATDNPELPPVEPAAEDQADAQSADAPEAAPAAGGGAAAGGAAGGDLTSSLSGYVVLAIIIALFVVPMWISNRLSKRLRMPDHSWKFATAMITLLAAGLVVWQAVLHDGIKFGPDLSGGIILIYELQDTSLVQDEGDQDDADKDPARDERQTVQQLIGALSERVDPSGTKEVTIREYGQKQIEIIIPKASQQELDFIERRIYTAGALEFRITVAPVFSENDDIIKAAKDLPLGENVVRLNGENVAEWVAYDEREFGPMEQEDHRIVKRSAGSTLQALVRIDDGQDVTGKYLRRASSGIDEQGRPEVRFSFNQEGAWRFGRLTQNHLPNASGQQYFLGIMLDKKLLSAPSILTKITSDGRITGSMGQEEVDFIVGILNAGSLPATLNKEPISRETISPTLGKETIEKGELAIGVSLAVVMVFMALYYRFAGVVACLALGANLLLILGLMVMLKAAFTLPGLAGLVLTVGMSVDANVLIFERIREELRRGAALRMAIRNGFGRATQTIIDANVTTLITAVVIYKIAPDSVKGFGVTLIIGIIVSMYAAIFLSRIVFDVYERTRRATTLKMGQIVGESHINFIGMRTVAAACSLVVIVIGIVATANRGEDLLNIDFTGGSSVMMMLKQDSAMNFSEVKDKLEHTELAQKNLSLVEVGGTGHRYTVSSIEEDVVGVQQLLHDTFGDDLQTYEVAVESIGPIAAADTGEDEEADPFAGGSQAVLKFSLGEGLEEDAGVTYEAVSQLVSDAVEATGNTGKRFTVSNDDYRTGSARRFDTWDVKIALPVDQANEVFRSLAEATQDKPVFPLANKIGNRIAGDMRTLAIAATVISLLFIVLYIWFRFQSVYYGLAAVIALVHDVLVTLGVVSLSAFLVNHIPLLANALLIEKFQISLPMVAAFLTIIGYSLNDTIVVFDRVREVKGKSPRLTADMLNTSINQTLSRTLLTSFTTLITVLILYALGGDGIHGFAFALVVGVIVGTYSSIFIASPALLWMSGTSEQAKTN